MAFVHEYFRVLSKISLRRHVMYNFNKLIIRLFRSDIIFTEKIHIYQGVSHILGDKTSIF